MVYGLLGLAETEKNEVLRKQTRGIFADYSLSPFELYLKVVKNTGGYGHQFSLGIPGDFMVPFDTEEATSADTVPKTIWQAHPSRLSSNNMDAKACSIFYGQPFIIYLKKGQARRFENTRYPNEPPANITSMKFLAYVRSLDWKNLDSWPDNYKAIETYSKSCPGRFLMRLWNLDLIWHVHYRWAVTTLGEDVEVERQHLGDLKLQDGVPMRVRM